MRSTTPRPAAIRACNFAVPAAARTPSSRRAAWTTRTPWTAHRCSHLCRILRGGGGPGASALFGANAQGFYLPDNKVISLSVIEGPAKGQALSLEKPVVVLGRSDADFTIGDPNISRHHCAVEVRGDAVRLRDLDSTNGTFVGLERVRAAELRHLSEFRMGLTVVLVTITPKLHPPL